MTVTCPPRARCWAATFNAGPHSCGRCLGSAPPAALPSQHGCPRSSAARCPCAGPWGNPAASQTPGSPLRQLLREGCGPRWVKGGHCSASLLAHLSRARAAARQPPGGRLTHGTVTTRRRKQLAVEAAQQQPATLEPTWDLPVKALAARAGGQTPRGLHGADTAPGGPPARRSLPTPTFWCPERGLRFRLSFPWDPR